MLMNLTPGYETLFKDVTLFCSMVCIRHSWAASCTACSAALRTSRWGQLPSCLSSHLSMQARDQVILGLFLHVTQPTPTSTHPYSVDLFFAKFCLLNFLRNVLWCLNYAATCSDQGRYADFLLKYL